MEIKYCTRNYNFRARKDCERCKFVNDPQNFRKTPDKPVPECIRVVEGELTSQGDPKNSVEGEKPILRRL